MVPGRERVSSAERGGAREDSLAQAASGVPIPIEALRQAAHGQLRRHLAACCPFGQLCAAASLPA